ncbi:hypothetical protein Tco_0603241 [Tanacetum coccineum]
MTRFSNKWLVEPYDEPEQALHSLRKLFKTTSFDHSSSPEFELFSDHEEQVEEEITETMTEPTMDEYMRKTREDYGSGVARLKFDKDAKFELKDVTQDQLMLRVFPISLTGAASRWLRNEPAGSITTWEILKGKFLSKYCPPSRTAKRMEEINNFKQEPNETLSSVERFKELLLRCPQHFLTNMHENNLGREIKKVNERVYDAQVGCELCSGPHYSKDCPLKDEGKTLEEAYYTQFGVPFSNARRYRAAALGFYQRDNGNPSYQERR